MVSLSNSLKSLFLGLSFSVLFGCGGGSDSSLVDHQLSYTTDINDPLLSYQWALYNTGQAADSLTGIGGTAGEDINAFGTDVISIANYAGGYQGRDVNIAIVDSGLEIGHEDLSQNVLDKGSYNFLNKSNDPTSSSTTGDHGTSVAGIAAARGGNGIGIWGTAPLSRLQGFNLLASGGGLNEELAALGYEDARAKFTGLRSDLSAIFNKSYGDNPSYVAAVNSMDRLYTDSILDGMKYGITHLRNGKGAIYVKATGNEYEGGSAFTRTWCAEAIAHNITCFNTNQEPEQATPYQIVVGAFNAKGLRSSYSNTGSALWVVAPGGEYGVNSPGVMSTDQSGCSAGYSRSSGATPATSFNIGALGSGNGSCRYYSAFNGTSSATPVLSGVAALLIEAYPDAGWRDIKHFLASTARQLQTDLAANTLNVKGVSVTLEQGWVKNSAGLGFSNAYGFGAVNVTDAVAMASDWKKQNKHLAGLVEVAGPTLSLSSQNEIPDFSATGLTQSQRFSQSLTVESIVLTLSIVGLDNNPAGNSHKIDASDYLIELTSPSGTKSILMTPFNAYRSGYDMPKLTLVSHAFYGEPLTGDWTLKVIDVDQNTQNAIQDVGKGKLTDWSMKVYGH